MSYRHAERESHFVGKGPRPVWLGCCWGLGHWPMNPWHRLLAALMHVVCTSCHRPIHLRSLPPTQCAAVPRLACTVTGIPFAWVMSFALVQQLGLSGACACTPVRSGGLPSMHRCHAQVTLCLTESRVSVVFCVACSPGVCNICVNISVTAACVLVTGGVGACSVFGRLQCQSMAALTSVLSMCNMMLCGFAWHVHAGSTCRRQGALTSLTKEFVSEAQAPGCFVSQNQWCVLYVLYGSVTCALASNRCCPGAWLPLAWVSTHPCVLRALRLLRCGVAGCCWRVMRCRDPCRKLNAGDAALLDPCCSCVLLRAATTCVAAIESVLGISAGQQQFIYPSLPQGPLPGSVPCRLVASVPSTVLMIGWQVRMHV